MYMFIGGTNFGFMAGANVVTVWPHFAPLVTSYGTQASLSAGAMLPSNLCICVITRAYELGR